MSDGIGAYTTIARYTLDRVEARVIKGMAKEHAAGVVMGVAHQKSRWLKRSNE